MADEKQRIRMEVWSFSRRVVSRGFLGRFMGEYQILWGLSRPPRGYSS
jgi:hypothetical protein